MIITPDWRTQEFEFTSEFDLDDLEYIWKESGLMTPIRVGGSDMNTLYAIEHVVFHTYNMQASPIRSSTDKGRWAPFTCSEFDEVGFWETTYSTPNRAMIHALCVAIMEGIGK